MPASSQQKEKRRTLIGFTLVFLVFSLPLIGVSLNYLDQIVFGESCTYSKTTAAEAQISTLKVAIVQYKTLNRALPTTEQGLSALVQPPEDARSKRKLVEANGILDPWRHPYRYQRPGLKSGGRYDLWSVGPDGLDGTKDDVRGWSEELAAQ